MSKAAVKRRIVVTDDTKFWREKFVMLLGSSGHEVIALDNGDDTIRVCLDPTRPVDLLILDLLMPGTDGFEVARYLRGRKLTSDLPIVAVTSLFKKEDFPNGTKAQGFDAILEKSASPDQFLFTFNKYLHSDVPSRRPVQRLATFLPATFLVSGGGESRGAITNLSRTGAFLSTATLIEAGSEILLSFTLPEGPTVKVNTQVVRVNNWQEASKNSYSRGMGVCFDDLPPSVAKAIDEYVKNNMD